MTLIVHSLSIQPFSHRILPTMSILTNWIFILPVVLLALCWYQHSVEGLSANLLLLRNFCITTYHKFWILSSCNEPFQASLEGMSLHVFCQIKVNCLWYCTSKQGQVSFSRLLVGKFVFKLSCKEHSSILKSSSWCSVKYWWHNGTRFLQRLSMILLA